MTTPHDPLTPEVTPEPPERTVFAEPPAVPAPPAPAPEPEPEPEPEGGELLSSPGDEDLPHAPEPEPEGGELLTSPGDEDLPHAPEPEPEGGEVLTSPGDEDLPHAPEPEPEGGEVLSSPGDEEVPQPPAEEPAAGAWQPSGAVLGLLVGVVVLLLGAVAFLGVAAVKTSGPTSDEENRKAALAAGNAAAKLVFSYDYRHLDDDFAKGSAVTTGEFKTQYAKTTKEVVSDVAPRYKTSVVAEVSEGGVIRSTDRTVTLLLFVNQRSTSTLSKSTKLTTSRVEMELTLTGDRWLVSKIRAL